MDRLSRFRIYGEIKNFVINIHAFNNTKEYDDFIRILSDILGI